MVNAATSLHFRAANVLHQIDVPSDGNGKVEDGKHDGPLLIGVEVSQDGRRDRGEAGLAETDRRAEKEERPETLQ